MAKDVWVQVPSIVLPQVWVTGLEVEAVNDLVAHVSLDIDTRYFGEKIIHIMAIEVGVPGNLQCWIEVSPIPSANTSWWPAPFPAGVGYFAAIGGGGGALPPVAPLVEGPIGAGTVHTMILPWLIHSPIARVVVQMPVAVAPAANYWNVQCLITAKAP